MPPSVDPKHQQPDLRTARQPTHGAGRPDLFAAEPCLGKGHAETLPEGPSKQAKRQTRAAIKQRVLDNHSTLQSSADAPQQSPCNAMVNEVEGRAPPQKQSGRLIGTSATQPYPGRKPAPGRTEQEQEVAPGALPLLHGHLADHVTTAAEVQTVTSPPETAMQPSFHLEAPSSAEQKGRQELASPDAQREAGSGERPPPARPDHGSATIDGNPRTLPGSTNAAGPTYDQPDRPLQPSDSSGFAFASETMNGDAPRQPGLELKASGEPTQPIGSGKQRKGAPRKRKAKTKVLSAERAEQASSSDAGGTEDDEAGPPVLGPKKVRGARGQKQKGRRNSQKAPGGSKAEGTTPAGPPEGLIPDVQRRPTRQRKSAVPYWLGAAAAKPSVPIEDKGKSSGRRPKVTEEAGDFAGASPARAMPVDGGAERSEEGPTDSGGTDAGVRRPGRRQRGEAGPEEAEKAKKRTRDLTQQAVNGQELSNEDQSEDEAGHAEKRRKSNNNGEAGDAGKTSDIPAQPAHDRQGAQGRGGGSRKRQSRKTGSGEGNSAWRKSRGRALRANQRVKPDEAPQDDSGDSREDNQDPNPDATVIPDESDAEKRTGSSPSGARLDDLPVTEKGLQDGAALRGRPGKGSSSNRGLAEGLNVAKRRRDPALPGKDGSGIGPVPASSGPQASPGRRLTRITKRQRTEALPAEAKTAGPSTQEIQKIDASQTHGEPQPKQRQQGLKAANNVPTLSPTDHVRPGKVTLGFPPAEAPADSALMGPSPTSMDASTGVGMLKEDGQRAVSQIEPLPGDLHETSLPPAVGGVSSEEHGRDGAAPLAVPPHGDQAEGEQKAERHAPAAALQPTVRTS